VQVEHGLGGLTEELVGAVIVALKQPAPHPHGDPWWACQAERATIEKQIKAGLRLTKIWRLLKRDGIEVPYSTLHRFAVQELGFGRKAATVPIVDGEPGHELQVDGPNAGQRFLICDDADGDTPPVFSFCTSDALAAGCVTFGKPHRRAGAHASSPRHRRDVSIAWDTRCGAPRWACRSSATDCGGDELNGASNQRASRSDSGYRAR
jgi:hypothetical protein